MMDSCGNPCITVDLDSVENQQNGRGGKILEVLNAQNNCPTIPQIYLGDEFVGGATDLFDIGRAGDLAAKLEAQNIPFNDNIRRDPYSYLPAWLHPR